MPLLVWFCLFFFFTIICLFYRNSGIERLNKLLRVRQIVEFGASVCVHVSLTDCSHYCCFPEEGRVYRMTQVVRGWNCMKVILIVSGEAKKASIKRLWEHWEQEIDSYKHCACYWYCSPGRNGEMHISGWKKGWNFSFKWMGMTNVTDVEQSFPR